MIIRLPITSLILLILAQCPLLRSQTTDSSAEIQQLKSQLLSQQTALGQQQAQIRELQSALARQERMLVGAVQVGTGSAKLVPTVDRLVDLTDLDLTDPQGQSTNPQGQSGAQAQSPPPSGENPQVPSEPPKVPAAGPLTPEQEQVQDELERGPEIADVTPETPALHLGPANIRLIGYPAMTGVWRSVNSGGNVGTSFGSIPYTSSIAGNTSEFRISPQSTRLALRADADLKGSYAAGYFEMDFGGSPIADNIAVTSSSFPFRIRHAFFDWGRGKWELTGGQLFSLMTPNKKGILPWPGDAATTQVIDTNYVVGLIQTRSPQFRVVYHQSKSFALGFSIENPEQQVGSTVVFPSGLMGTASTQYNGSGGTQLKVPNLTPDFVVKGSYDTKITGDRALHLDVGGLLRSFRNYDGSSNLASKAYAMGWGVGANFNVEFTKKVRWVLNGFAGAGGGRYIGGLVPDVILKPNGQISPIRSYSGVTGFEIAPSKESGWYVYYSGVYSQRDSALNSDGTCCVGFGFPGASNAANRLIAEATGGYSRVFWKFENIGSMQWGVQYAYQWLQPWVAGKGPSQAQQHMVFTQVRYNLP